jgi:hypothetical protein
MNIEKSLENKLKDLAESHVINFAAPLFVNGSSDTSLVNQLLEQGHLTDEPYNGVAVLRLIGENIIDLSPENPNGNNKLRFKSREDAEIYANQLREYFNQGHIITPPASTLRYKI